MHFPLCNSFTFSLLYLIFLASVVFEPKEFRNVYVLFLWKQDVLTSNSEDHEV